MGCMAAAYLQRAGQQVHALARPNPQTDSLSRHIRFPQQNWQALQLPVVSPTYIRYLLLATKAGQTAAALRPWLPYLTEDATLVCLQNGMGQLDAIKLPTGIRRIHAVTTNGAYRNAQGVTVVAENSTYMGDGTPQPPDWFSALASAWPSLMWEQDIRLKQWEKLAINAVINPLTAIHQCRNGELVQSYLTEMQQLASEVDAVLCRLDANWPANTLQQATRVARLTATNTSSMCADVKAGRATEIDFINGWFLQQATQHQVSMPLTHKLVAQLSA